LRSLLSTTGSTSTAPKPAPSSTRRYWKMPWKPMTLAIRELPWLAAGK